LSDSFELKKLIFVATDIVFFVSSNKYMHTYIYINSAQVELENVELCNTPFVTRLKIAASRPINGRV